MDNEHVNDRRVDGRPVDDSRMGDQCLDDRRLGDSACQEAGRHQEAGCSRVRRPHAWLIGGTQESAELAIALTDQNIPYIVSVTTSSAQRLYPNDANVWIGPLTAEDMSGFIHTQKIHCILDASHPFACEISRQAIATALPYLRFERERLFPKGQTQPQTDDLITHVDSLDTLIKSKLLRHQRVLFTIGYRNLKKFAHLRPSTKLFARILPSSDAISGTLAAGFSPQEIMAIRPPVSAALEAALWRQWQITQVVAKASGKAGGEATKRQVSAQLGIPLILISRPPVHYPKQTNSVQEAVKFCSEALSLY